MQKIVPPMRWSQYMFFLFLGLFLFVVTVFVTLYYLWDLRMQRPERSAYDHHVMMLAQISLERLTHRLDLASVKPESAESSETQPALEQQLEITWSRFNDLTQGDNAERLRLIPGLKMFVGKISSSLEQLEQQLNASPQAMQSADYEQASQQFSRLREEFFHTATNLPVRLLPIYAEQLSRTHAKYDWYYLGLIISCLLVFFIYSLTLWRLVRTLKTMS